MKFSEDFSQSALNIQAYGNHWIQVKQQRFQQTFAIVSDQIITQGFPTDIEQLHTTHLSILIAGTPKPDLIIIGTNKETYRPATAFYPLLSQHQIGFEIMQTPAACRTYNLLLSESRRVAALFFPPT